MKPPQNPERRQEKQRADFRLSRVNREKLRRVARALQLPETEVVELLIEKYLSQCAEECLTDKLERGRAMLADLESKKKN